MTKAINGNNEVDENAIEPSTYKKLCSKYTQDECDCEKPKTGQLSGSIEQKPFVILTLFLCLVALISFKITC